MVRIVEYYLPTPTSPAQIGMDFVAGRSLRDALPRLNDTKKVIVVVGLALVMKFIDLREDIHRDLKLANILFDDRGHPKIGDFGISRFCDLALTATSGVETPLYMAPEMGDPHMTRLSDVS
jgi:serine/threonine-protein kinase